MWTETIFTPKTGGECEAPSCPGPESSLETPRTCWIPPLALQRHPSPLARSPSNTLSVRSYEIALCSVLCPKAAVSELQEGSRTFPTNMRAEEREKVGKEAKSSHYHRPGWGCGSVGRMLSWHVRKPGVPSTQPLGSESRGATWALSSAHIQPSAISRVTDKHQRWSQSPSVPGTTGLSRSQIKPRNTLFCDVSVLGWTPGSHTLPLSHVLSPRDKHFLDIYIYMYICMYATWGGCL